MRITFLGTGGSPGVPLIGCGCPVCTSPDPRNRRTRPSALLQLDGKSVLVDVSPDFRYQALKHGVESVDAVLFTHAHADHCLGFDDLRIVIERQRRQVPVFGSARTLDRIEHLFDYMFISRLWRSETLRVRAVTVDEPFDLFGTRCLPLDILHDTLPILGFRFGPAAYVTDASLVPESSMKALTGLDLLVVNALRYAPHPKHFSVAQALELIERLRPRRALLTHMNHELDYEKLKEELPTNVHPAYDGLTVEI